MSLAVAVNECPVFDSFRVQQIAGMFDVPLAEKCRQEFSVEVPGLDEEWQIGVIVGPSGSGKSTIASNVFGDALYHGEEWAPDKAVIDGFDQAASIKDVTHLLTAVGFSSPPSWVKPYHVLSNGEKFRCDLARSLAGDRPVIAFDEFTSVVDRTVAKIGSAAVSKAIRSGKVKRRFVAVTCHYDVVEWLEPDWVVDMATRTLARGRLRRPEIRLEIFRCHHSAWRLFARHHYLSRVLANSARCYIATVEGEPAGFCAMMPSIGHKGIRRVSRIVVLPDYQGVGIGSHLLNAVASIFKAEGHRVTITTSHPAMIGHLKRASNWTVKSVMANGHGKHTDGKLGLTSSGRAVISSEYIGD